MRIRSSVGQAVPECDRSAPENAVLNANIGDAQFAGGNIDTADSTDARIGRIPTFSMIANCVRHSLTYTLVLRRSNVNLGSKFSLFTKFENSRRCPYANSLLIKGE